MPSSSIGNLPHWLSGRGDRPNSVRSEAAQVVRTHPAAPHLGAAAPRPRGIRSFRFSVVLYAGLTRPEILHIHAVGPAIVTPIARLARSARRGDAPRS
jgi:hypothetical protein